MEAKRLAAEKAVEWIKDGMTIGLGTGSTAYWAICKIGERIQEGLNIRAVASSRVTEQVAREVGIPLITFAEVQTLDLTIDGADEVDRDFNLVKGGGGALLREKILAYNSQTFLVIVDENKLVGTLGRYPLPVEVVPFAAEQTLRHLADLGCSATLRKDGDALFTTDNNHYIADCRFEQIPDPAALDVIIRTIPGVVETGLFVHNMVSHVIVGYRDGDVQVM
ncbi:MAG TPA: ribose-5-phosphate isomerase RpiA [Chitinophagaceae bacterium]